MKKIFTICLITLFFSCTEEVDPVLFDSINGQTALGFVGSFQSVIVPEEGVTAQAPIQVTTISSTDRTYEVIINTELSTGTSADYTIGTATIPANSHEGLIDVTFGNFDGLQDLITFALVLELVIPEGQADILNQRFTFNYIKEIICNDLKLTLNEDFYSNERTWEVRDSDGVVVESGGPYPPATGGQTIIVDFPLVDGCYVFEIMDSYGDGQFDGNITGSYTLTCSVITHASGTGNWGASDITNFCVNP